MSTLLLSLRGLDSNLTAPIAVEVIDADLEVIEELSVSPSGSREVEVKAGKYLVRAKLPSGEVITEKAYVRPTDHTKEVILRIPNSPHEWLQWQHFLGNTKFINNGRLSVYPSTWLRLWRYDGKSWRIKSEFGPCNQNNDDSVINYHFNTPNRTERNLHFLQIGGPQVPWHFVALPPTENLEVLVYLSKNTAEFETPLEVAIVSHDKASESLLSYLTLGSFESAKVVADEIVRDAENLLFKKKENPMGAAIGGYFLLKTRAFNRLHDWPNNFANWFNWLPDAAVIHAWQLLSIGRDTPSKQPRVNSPNFGDKRLEKARARLLQAASQGIPVYTQGLRLLLDGLQLFAKDPEDDSETRPEREDEDFQQDWAINLALERVRSYAAAADWSRPLTTFYGETPDRPSLALRTGIPESSKELLFWVVDPASSTDMTDMDAMLKRLGKRFGILAESDTYQLTVVAQNADVAVGDLFLLPSRRGDRNRFYIFRTTQYANILNRSLEMGDIARNKLTMPDSYFSQNLADEQLIELKGIVLGYAEANGKGWAFHRPRRLPEHLTDVYQVTQENASVLRELLASQLQPEGIMVGYLLAGETAIAPRENDPGIVVRMPVEAVSTHIGIFGRTGVGKSNLMMVLIEAMFRYNMKTLESGKRVSMLAIDPHDEFLRWHVRSGGRDGIQGIVEELSGHEKMAWVEPFYYLTARRIDQASLQQTLHLSWADVTPQDLFSVIDFTEQQVAYANQLYRQQGEDWISRLLQLRPDVESDEGGVPFMQGTKEAVMRRVGFLQPGQTTIFTPFNSDNRPDYESLLPEIICALEKGRIITVDTTLMGELEQFLLTTIVARVLFALRKALRSAEDLRGLKTAIRQALDNDDHDSFGEMNRSGRIGMRSLANRLIEALNDGELPYLKDDGQEICTPDDLPHVNVVIEEAPSVLNPQRLKFGSVFRDIARQGRKFRIGLTVVSQQVSEIDDGILSQINTELFMGLGNDTERKEAIKNASVDLSGFERELQVMEKGQVLFCASYRDIPLPVKVPEFDKLGVTNGR